ncbi:MAG: hypothetical protein LUG18_13995 [Candidatus Azobacteroides sp.]|nr:hypothetical protein [Candidatus Azobacteroides sp.]
MKKGWFFFLFLVVLLPASAQYYQRMYNESASDFIERIKPEGKNVVHEVIETTWNSGDTKVIFAFWEIDVPAEDNSYTGVDVDGKLLVPVDNSLSYKMIDIDMYPEDPYTPHILSVFFYDTDGDGQRELIVLYAWTINTYEMGGTSYEAAIYKPVNYSYLPEKLTRIEYLNGGMEASNIFGEEFRAVFKDAAGVCAILKNRKKIEN